MTDRITLWNPEVRNANGELDIQKSEANSEDFVLHVKSKIEEGEDVLFVFDGIDKWLDCCTLHVTGSSKIGKPQKMKFEWGKRNAPFYSLLMMCKNLNCDQIYITHSKADYGATGEVIGAKPNWHNWVIIFIKSSQQRERFVKEMLSTRLNYSAVKQIPNLLEQFGNL